MITLIGPCFNWSEYIDLIKGITNKSPIKCLDDYDLKIDNPYSMLVSLQKLRDPNWKPWTDEPDSDLLAHFFCTFLAQIPYSQLEYLVSSRLSYSKIDLDRNNCLIVLTGTLLDWKIMLPDLLKTKCGDLFREIHIKFKKTDFRFLWNNHLEKKTADGYILEVKR